MFWSRVRLGLGRPRLPLHEVAGDGVEMLSALMSDTGISTAGRGAADVYK